MFIVGWAARYSELSIEAVSFLSTSLSERHRLLGLGRSGGALSEHFQCCCDERHVREPLGAVHGAAPCLARCCCLSLFVGLESLEDVTGVCQSVRGMDCDIVGCAARRVCGPHEAVRWNCALGICHHLLSCSPTARTTNRVRVLYGGADHSELFVEAVVVLSAGHSELLKDVPYLVLMCMALGELCHCYSPSAH
jgi:hypothetical protein